MNNERRLMLTSVQEEGGGDGNNASVFIIPFYTTSRLFSSQYNELFETVYQSLKKSAENPYQYPVFIIGQMQWSSEEEQYFYYFTHIEVDTRLNNCFKGQYPGGKLFTYQIHGNGSQWEIVYPS